MTQEQLLLLMVQGKISDLSSEQQKKIRETADKLRAIRKEADDEESGIGMMAMALVTAEMGAEE